MPTESTQEAPSAAPQADAKADGPSNLTVGQAAARLFAKGAETSETTAPNTAAEETAPEKSDETQSAPAAEAQAASVEAESEDDSKEPEEIEADAKAEETADDPEVHSQSNSKFTPEQQEVLNKKIAKEVRKTEALKAKLQAEHSAKIAELETRLKQAPQAAEPAATQPVTAPSLIPGPQPLVQYNDIPSLEQLQGTAKHAVRWAEQTLENPRAWKTKVQNDGNGEEVEVRVTQVGDKTYTEDEVRDIKARAKVTLEDDIPARANFITAREQARNVAHAEFPFLKDRTSAEYQAAQSMLRDPMLQSRPDAEWIVGVHLRGLKAMQADRAAAKAATDKTKAPVKSAVKTSSDQTAVSATAAAQRVPVSTANNQKLNAERSRLRTKGGITTAEAVASLMNRDRLRNSR